MQRHEMIRIRAIPPGDAVAEKTGGGYPSVVRVPADLAPILSVPADNVMSMNAPTRYAVLDLETTGLSPNSDQTVEIAVVTVVTEPGLPPTITAEWDTLVRPRGAMRAEFVHGITTEMVLEAPPFPGIAGELLELLRGCVPVAHNLNFDSSFLVAEFARCDIYIPDPAVVGLDTVELARAYLPPGPLNLSACCERAGVELHGAHTALGDARATAELLCNLLERIAGLGEKTPALPFPRVMPEPQYSQGVLIPGPEPHPQPRRSRVFPVS